MQVVWEHFMDPLRRYCGTFALEQGEYAWRLHAAIWRMPWPEEGSVAWQPAPFDIDFTDKEPLQPLPRQPKCAWPVLQRAIHEALRRSELKLGHTSGDILVEIDRILKFLEPHLQILSGEKAEYAFVAFNPAAMCTSCRGRGCAACHETGVLRN